MAVLTFQMHHVRLNDDVSQAAPKWRHLHPPCARGGRARPGGSGADRRDQVNNYLWHLITLATWCDLLRAANGGNRPGVIAGIGLTRFSHKWTSHWWQINQTRLKRISARLWWPLGLLHYAIEPIHMRRVCCWKYIYIFFWNFLLHLSIMFTDVILQEAFILAALMKNVLTSRLHPQISSFHY